MRAVLLAVVLSLGCDSSVVRIGAPSGPSEQRTAEALVRELGERDRASHIVDCKTPRGCVERLLAGDVDLVIVDAVTAESIPKAVVLAATPIMLEPTLVVPLDSPIQNIDDLAARHPGKCIAVSTRLLHQPRHGYAALGRAYGLRSESIVIDEIGERLAALDDKRCDLALVEKAELVGNYRELNDSRLALKGSAYLVVALGDDDALRRAAGAVGDRFSSMAVKSMPIAMPEGADHAFNAVARGLDGATRSVVASEPLALLRSGEAPLALVSDEARAEGLEAVVTYERVGAAALTLWQRGDGPLGRAQSERLLAASKAARLPDPRHLSVWKRRPPTKPREDAARPWLDSVVNVLVLGFMVWLMLVIFRRKRPGMFDSVTRDE